MTSYWGLRDYGTGLWEGGDAECDHLGQPHRTQTGFNERYFGKEFGNDKQGELREPYRQVCGKCGARRVDQQLGLEPTPDEYVANMVAVFREIRRVLRRDGTCWLNIGDSYAASGGNDRKGSSDGSVGRGDRPDERRRAGLKPKDLVGIPWRLAFALQADGWYLRADIIWSKKNCMPESVTDRPTKSHEYVFLLTRSARYFYDIEATREPHSPDGRHKTVHDHLTDASHPNYDNVGNGNERWPNGGRNVRSVWEIATQPYAEAHFATFPEALVERCVKAGTSEKGCCPECGAPWERETERGESDYARLKREQGHEWTDMDAAGLARGVILKEGEGGQTRNANGTVPSLRAASRTQVGWRSTCSCGTAQLPEVLDGDVEQVDSRREVPLLRQHLRAVPCVVLDPFMGSGTTALVARRLGRKSVGIELNAEYCALAARRLQQLSLLA